MYDEQFAWRPEVTELFASFGKPTAVYRASKWHTVGGLFVSVVMFGFSCSAIWLANTGQFGKSGEHRRQGDASEKEETQGRIVGYSLGSIGSLAAAIWTWWVLRSLTRRFVVCPEGVVDIWGGRVQPIPWSEVTGLDALAVENSVFKGILGLFIRQVHYEYVLRCRDGQMFAFNRAKIGGAAKLFDVLHEEAKKRGIPVQIRD